MPAYTTPFGLLTLEPNDGVLTSGRLRAELRGLELLNGIVSTAKTWSRKCSTDSWNTLLVTGMDGFELRIDVLKTVQSYLLRNDPHIVVELYRGRNRSVGTVERSSTISLIPDAQSPMPLSRWCCWANPIGRRARHRIHFVNFPLDRMARQTRSCRSDPRGPGRNRRCSQSLGAGDANRCRRHAVLFRPPVLHLQRVGD